MPLVQAAVNVVVPHPLVVVAAEAVASNDGNTNAIVLVVANGTFNAKLNEIADGAVITGLVMINKLCCNKDDAGAAITVDAEIATAVMSAASANVTVTVRSLRAGVDVELCPLALVVTPDPTVTSHLVPATRVGVLVAAVNIRVAVVVPEPDAVAAANVVVPH